MASWVTEHMLGWGLFGSEDAKQNKEHGRESLSLHRGQICVTSRQTKQTEGRMVLWRALALYRICTASNFFPPVREPG